MTIIEYEKNMTQSTKVFINRDLSPKERESEKSENQKNLRAELHRHRTTGEQNLVIMQRPNSYSPSTSYGCYPVFCCHYKSYSHYIPLRPVTRVGSTSKGNTPSLSVNRTNKQLKYPTCLWNSHSNVNLLICFQCFIYAHDYSFIALTESGCTIASTIMKFFPLDILYNEFKRWWCHVGCKSVFKSTQLIAPDNFK